MVKNTTEVDEKKAEKRMVAGRTRVVFDRPLYSPLLFKLELKSVPKLPGGTMATDGRSLMYVPEFAMGLSVDHLMFAILHETMHCAFRHPARRGHRDPEIWNIAGDLSINGILLFEENLSAPTWVLKDKKYLGWSTEKIYDELVKDKEAAKQKYKQKGSCCVQKDPTGGEDPQDGDKGDGEGDKEGQGSPSEGVPTDPRGWDAEWNKDTDEEWKQAVIAAQQYAKMRGTSPGWLNSMVDEIVEPPVPIERIVQHIVGTMHSDESSWRNPNRRFLSRGLRLPTTLRDKKKGVIIIDTSGSIDDETGKYFFGIAMRALRSKGINELRIIQCDTAVVSDETVKDISKLKLYIKRTGLRGRGGTSFRPPFELLEKKNTWDISFAVYLTDLCGDFPDRKPRFPVYWISVDEGIAPFGQTYYWDRKGNKVVPQRKPSLATN